MECTADGALDPWYCFLKSSKKPCNTRHSIGVTGSRTLLSFGVAGSRSRNHLSNSINGSRTRLSFGVNGSKTHLSNDVNGSAFFCKLSGCVLIDIEDIIGYQFYLKRETWIDRHLLIEEITFLRTIYIIYKIVFGD